VAARKILLPGTSTQASQKYQSRNETLKIAYLARRKSRRNTLRRKLQLAAAGGGAAAAAARSYRSVAWRALAGASEESSWLAGRALGGGGERLMRLRNQLPAAAQKTVPGWRLAAAAIGMRRTAASIGGAGWQRSAASHGYLSLCAQRS